MMENLGGARLHLDTDQSELDRGLDVAKAKTKGFLTDVQTLTKGAVGKALTGIAATGLAAATAQGLQLNEVLNQVQAATGATGDDWEAMQAVIRRENGRTTESMNGIGDAVTAMKQDLNLTGPEIAKYADRIFDAGLATHETAAQITKGADDIGDAYGVNIDRALGSIDQIIASQEKWGGSIQDRIAALPALARGVKGLNGDLDDSVALLNVASTAGLTYENVQQAINVAVGKFKTPADLKEVIGLQDVHKTKTQLAREEVEKIERVLADFVAPDALKQIIAQLNGIEDPTLRAAAAEKVYNAEVAKFSADPIKAYLDILGEIPDAQMRTQRAIELFGPKAGPVWAQLAEAVHAAGGDLSKFNITQEQAGDKATQVADQINRGPVRALKLLGEQLGAFLADAGSNPLITGIASFGTILGGFAPNLSGKIAVGIGKGIAGGFRAAAGLPIVSSAISWASDQASTIYLKALYAQDALSAGLAAMWRRAATSAPVTAALTFLGQTTAGRILAGVGVIAIPVTVALAVGAPLAQGIQDANEKELHDKLSAALQAGTDAAYREADEHLRQLERGARASHNDSWLKIILGEKADFEAGVRDRIGDIKDAGQFVARAAVEAGKPIEAAGKATGEKYGDAMIEAAKAYSPKIERGLSFALRGPITAAAASAVLLSHAQANRVAGAWGQEFRQHRDDVDSAWDEMLSGITHPTSVTSETAKLLGRLTSSKLIEGLHSKDPAVRDQAKYTKQLILDRLAELEPRSGTLSKAAMESLRKAMKSKDADIRNAAYAIYTAATAKPSTMPTAFHGYGTAAGAAAAAGLISQIPKVEAAAQRIAGAAGKYLFLSSPADEGPWSKGGGPEGWGERFTSFLARGIEGRISTIRSASQRVAEAARPMLTMPSLTTAIDAAAADVAKRTDEPVVARIQSMGTIRVEHTLSAKAADALAQAGFDAREVGKALADGANASGLFSNLQALQALNGSG